MGFSITISDCTTSSISRTRSGSAGTDSSAGAVSTNTSSVDALSPTSPILAMTSPTGMVSFTWAIISTIVPVAGEGISESTLSVEISNKVSSLAILSPTCFFHSRIVPSVIDSPILGITTSVILTSCSFEI